MSYGSSSRHSGRLRPARRARRARPAVAALTALLLAGAAGCDDGDGPADGAKASAPPGGSPSASAGRSPAAVPPSSPPPEAKNAPPSPSDSPEPPKPSAPPAGDGGGDGPLRGKVVVIDPGHNIHNQQHTAEIDRSVDIGTGRKECDTTGTSTNSGYAEATFSLDVAHRIRSILQAQGATVTLTHDGDRPFGPCVDERAAIGNKAHADAALSVHADGAAPGQRGVHVILPAKVKGGRADTAPIVDPSKELGERVLGRFVQATGSIPSNYIGHNTGLDVRSDLGGLNLSTVPKVFIECGNMRDPQDAAQLTDDGWRQKAAQGIADGIREFVLSR
ncbi:MULTISPECIES: N-acetylmuramoyl-L-alanine amidase [Streptomyces]|uniref:N-acetylmuramoyl-L-alanine amidase n=1 Tax=Streptomyces TaxID=1883 RepID=UPI00163C5C83|nr:MULTISPECIES: N-acetylmuramoyl-L-alanine amidase [Streptomyces]MBC2873988.1 N-acetylmuramoyl-L-alanine amidase [Streptomyces sp. TYQ1024]UBI39072.1 N-acetylmuramoyl-L-alanine amidase [Streptomyces mobaraensis]UKW31650.1 N-acetylmuramoyl-L-alanine amidase [Streptomyces sp. TYQ1024]